MMRYWISWLLWPLVLIGAAVLLFAMRGAVASEHIVLIFLLVVLGASAGGGRLLGVILATGAFIIFDWFFLPPYNTLVVRDPLDWLALIAFLATSLVAAQLLYAARAERAAVERAEALREADKLKDALLATVSHDLRTPLTSIKGLATELIETGDERALLIAEEADRLNRMVSNLLDIARLNAGNLKLDVHLNALDDLIGSAVQQFAGRPDRDRIVAFLEDPSDVVTAPFDFVQSLRIVTNLVENALKYSPPGSEVELSGGRRDANMIVSVSDRGPGIREEDRVRVFEEFGRGRAEHSARDGTSIGLGLAIARRLAELQGGSLRVVTRSGGGSTFELRIPMAV